jgi:hypothetical protein
MNDEETTAHDEEGVSRSAMERGLIAAARAFARAVANPDAAHADTVSRVRAELDAYEQRRAAELRSVPRPRAATLLECVRRIVADVDALWQRYADEQRATNRTPLELVAAAVDALGEARRATALAGGRLDALSEAHALACGALRNARYESAIRMVYQADPCSHASSTCGRPAVFESAGGDRLCEEHGADYMKPTPMAAAIRSSLATLREVDPDGGWAAWTCRRG